ncbi:phosphatidylglycerophosphatase A family protein [Paracoccus aestuariivivens]|uniref:Phosphatidylglycerophosphatase A n=1 Tax=Paracoccus aestuariivivens TaxID=1820333 RepID=A0A6L6JAY9_9RHOB|nr:phosphatidylglycerophosphatase A [Paracoccus aestuariivivens]MTH79373.1 phosphatidylglycerophosphatase A [Paracoccus aestuariivivens]
MDKQIATFFGVGLMRPAPGTWGSAAAVALAVLACELGSALLVPLGFVIATVLGFWAVPRVVADRENKDPSEIVIDEVAGQWLAMCFTVIPLWRHGVSILDAWPAYVVPFLLFRLFDIRKPWLVGRADRRGDAKGVMLDDLWAGLFAGIVSVILAGLYHAVLEPML